MLLSIGYLIFEIAHTSKLNVQPWKADSLLPIYTQLESELVSLAAQGTNEPDGLTRRIGAHRVRLGMKDGTLAGFA